MGRGRTDDEVLQLPPVFHAVRVGFAHRDWLVEKPSTPWMGEADAPADSGQPHQEMIARVFADGDGRIKTFPAQLGKDLKNFAPRPAPEPVFSTKSGPGGVELDEFYGGIIRLEEDPGVRLGQNGYRPIFREEFLQGGGHERRVANSPEFKKEDAFHGK